MNYFPSIDQQFLANAVPLSLAAVIAYRLLNVRWEGDWKGGKTIESPVYTKLPSLSIEQQDDLPYPPNTLPGARDVDSPYGSIRVYEWGNEDGPKVLLIHGISTPCVSLAGVAKRLAASGCRVMLFDLFGRGYSATPDPSTNPQSLQLFTTQIHLALSSSPLSWTGPSRFALIGYSLGGGIAASFTSYFPRLVSSLILIAPAGLLRPHRIAFSSRLVYSGLLPSSLVRFLVGRRLASGGVSGTRKGGNPEATGPAKAVEAEVPGHPADAKDSEAEIEGGRGMSVARAVQWQLENNEGFVPAFISSVQHAPITEQAPRWRIVGERLRVQRAGGAKDGEGLREGKVLIVLGKEDGVIVQDEVVVDARACLGEEGMVVKMVDAGHDLPIVKPKEVTDAILDFWKR